MKEQLAKQGRVPTRTHAATHRTSRHDQQDDSCLGGTPHRAGHFSGIHPEDRPTWTEPQPRTTQRPRPMPLPDEDEDEDESSYPQRPATSVRRYWPVEEQGRRLQAATQQPRTLVRYHYERRAVPPRQHRGSTRTQSYSQQEQDPTTGKLPRQPRQVWHPLVSVGLTLLVGVLLFIGISIVGAWWHTLQDDWHYGRPRTFQCDARVGHHDARTPSHFLALNLNKQIEVIEFPGGDATHAKVYLGPTLIGEGQELTPVTLTFQDVTGDGKPDMVLHIGSDTRYVLVNDTIDGVPQFRPPRPGETVNL